LCHLSAGLPDQALHFANQCLAACKKHDASAYEHFFAHEALARVQHACGDVSGRASSVAAAQAAFATLPADDQEACRSALAELQALAP